MFLPFKALLSKSHNLRHYIQGDELAQGLLSTVGRGPEVAGIDGGVPITLRMRLECTLVKAADKVHNGGSG